MHKALRETILVALPKVGGGLSVLLLNLYIVRCLSPAAYGHYALCATIVLLLDGIISTAVDLAVIRAATQDATPGAATAWSHAELAGAAVKLGAAGLLMASAALLGDRIGNALLHRPDARALMLVTGASVGSQFLFRSLQTHFQIRSMFRLYGACEFVQVATRGALILACVLSGIRAPEWLVGAYCAAPLLVVLSFVSCSLRPGLPTLPSWLEVRSLARAAAAPAVTLATGGLAARMDVFFLAMFGTPSQLGVYGAAQAVIVIPEILGSYIAPVLTPRIMPYCREGRFYRFYIGFYRMAYAAAAAASVGAALLAAPVLSLVFPASYSQSVQVIQRLAPGAVIGFLLFPLTLNFLMFFSPRTFLWYDILTAPVLALVYTIAAPHGAIAVASATLGARLVKTAVIQVRATQLARTVGVGSGADRALLQPVGENA